MQLSDLRLGYFPGACDFSAPCDRRRFVYYANKRGLSFELADPSREYDLVVLSQRADVGAWSRYPRGRTKIVFDAIDSYLAIAPWDMKGMLRGAAKFVTGQSARLELSHLRATQALCSRADAVVCSTEEQRQAIAPFCSNVHLVLDIHEQELGPIKTSYAAGETSHVVWEGLASSGIPLTLLRDILVPLTRTRRIALHLVTDAIYRRFSNKVWKCHTADEVAGVFDGTPVKAFVYDWNPLALSALAVRADLALIPIDLENPFHNGKPENKLLLFWRMGVPVVTSATPAYARVMERCSLQMTCKSLDDWHSVVAKYLDDANAREHAGRTGRSYVDSNHSAERTLALWDRLFESL